MLTEYLALGGVEIANNARAYANAACCSDGSCVSMLRCPGCEGLHDALGSWEPPVYEWQTLWTNEALNPSFETLSSMVAETRRNYSYDPGAVNLNYWISTAGLSLTPQVPGAPGISTSMEFTANGSEVGGYLMHVIPDLTVGMQYVASGWFYHTAPNASYWDVAVGAAMNTVVVAGGFDLSPGWQWISIGFTASSTVMNLHMRRATAQTGNWPARMTGILVEQGSTIPASTSWFSGSYSPVTESTPSWTGATNASPSILSAVTAGNAPVAPIPGSAGVGIQAVQTSTAWAASGTRSLWMLPSSASNVSYYQLGNQVNTNYPVGTPVRVSAIFHLDAPQTGTLNQYARTITAVTDAGVLAVSAQAPNEAGDHEITLVFTVPATATWAAVRLWNGAPLDATDGNDVWVDDLLITGGDYTGGYFDGATIPDDVDDAGSRTSWTGTAHESSSILEGLVRISDAHSTDAPYGCGNRDSDPWHDNYRPESTDFIGSYLVDITGVTDSTMSATVVQSTMTGGVIQRPRHSTRTITVRVLLIGCNQRGAEYGLAWLKRAVDVTYCGRHEGRCGVSDLEFFIDCPPAITPDDANYGTIVDQSRRALHGVACTTGPIITTRREAKSGAVLFEVEFELTAQNPYIYSTTVGPYNPDITATVYDELAYNLLRYPSAEVGDGVQAIVSRNYAINGSAEKSSPYTGWSGTISGNVHTNNPTLTPRTYRHVAGPQGMQCHPNLVSSNLGTGNVYLFYTVDFSALGMPAGANPTLSLWTAASYETSGGGAGVLDSLVVQVRWKNASAVTVATDIIDTWTDESEIVGGVTASARLFLPEGESAVSAQVVAILQYTVTEAGPVPWVWMDAVKWVVP